MGCWIRAKGRLEVLPPPDEELMMEFWCFGEMECPEEYLVRGERFLNENRTRCIHWGQIEHKNPLYVK